MTHGQIFNHGRVAATQGKPITVNPFMGTDAERWRAGYRAGLQSPAEALTAVRVQIATAATRGRRGRVTRRAMEAGR